MLPAKFQVTWPLCSGEVLKNRLFKMGPWGLSWISDQNDFSYFLSTSHPDASYQVSSQLAFGSGEEAKIDFQDGRHGGNLGFPIETILVIFDLQVTPMLLSSFKSIRLSIQEKKRKNDFQDGGHGGHLCFPIGTVLAILDLHVDLMHLPGFKSTGFSVEEKKRKIYFQVMAAIATILDFRSKRF